MLVLVVAICVALFCLLGYTYERKLVAERERDLEIDRNAALLGELRLLVLSLQDCFDDGL